MKVGLIARGEARGLGHMTREFYRHMNPDKVLLVIPEGVRHAHLTTHLDWYPDATVIGYNGALDEAVCRDWLDGLDAVYSAETFYDWAFCRWADEQHVATVCHLMPEWTGTNHAAEPTQWWAPTSWLLNELPQGTRHVPVPIATDHYEPLDRKPGPFRWLHVAGAKTYYDRNGTKSLLTAARCVTTEQEIIVRTQTDGIASCLDNVTVETSDVTNYWDVYRDADALVMPRRYAGLCLPVLEAFGQGLPVIMSDMAPQNVDWPVRTVKTEPAAPVTIRRPVPTGDVRPRALATLMDEWVTSPAVVGQWRQAANDYAVANSWEVRASEVRAELEEVADRVAA